MSETQQSGRRPVPKHIDKSERIGEIALIFGLVFFVVRIPVVLLTTEQTGAETGYLLLAAIALAYLYHRATVGQKPGYLLHLGYRAGFSVKGLLRHSLKRVAK